MSRDESAYLGNDTDNDIQQGWTRYAGCLPCPILYILCILVTCRCVCRFRVGMRHRIVHDYMDVDCDVVWAVATQDLPALIEELQKIMPPDGAE